MLSVSLCKHTANELRKQKIIIDQWILLFCSWLQAGVTQQSCFYLEICQFRAFIANQHKSILNDLFLYLDPHHCYHSWGHSRGSYQEDDQDGRRERSNYHRSCHGKELHHTESSYWAGFVRVTSRLKTCPAWPCRSVASSRAVLRSETRVGCWTTFWRLNCTDPEAWLTCRDLEACPTSWTTSSHALQTASTKVWPLEATGIRTSSNPAENLTFYIIFASWHL